MSVTFDSAPGWNINFRGINHIQVSKRSNLKNTDTAITYILI